MAMADGLRFQLGPAELSEDAYGRVSDIALFIRTLSVALKDHDIFCKIIERTQFSSLKSLSIQGMCCEENN